MVKAWQSKIVIIGDDNPQLTQDLDDNQKKQTGIELQLSTIKDEFERKKQTIVADCEAKVKDLPNVFAMQLKDKEDAQKRAITAKAVAFNQAQADKGDAYGLLRMGERYRDGDGVPKDLARAVSLASSVMTPCAQEKSGQPQIIDPLLAPVRCEVR